MAEDVELAESVSVALLIVLKTLGPAERAVFVLREVFAVPYDEIGEAVGKTPAAVRQIAHRARKHVAARLPRMDVNRGEQQEVVERFLAMLQGGDMQQLFDVLAPDVVLVTDGGGLAPAALRPIEGAAKVVAFLAGLARVAGPFETRAVTLNGAPAGRVDYDGELDTVVSFVVENGRISRIYAIRNPHKLARLEAPAPLTRE